MNDLLFLHHHITGKLSFRAEFRQVCPRQEPSPKWEKYNNRKQGIKNMTVREIVDEIIAKAGVEPLPEDKTCDHLMTGSWDMEVKGIVSTFMATVDVIKETINLGANFIITHEPTWFSGADDTEWLSNDPVYLEKKKLIEEHNIAIWRFHDHMHMSHEDGIYRGFDEELDWAKYRVAGTGELGWFGAIYELPETTLEELALFFQKKMDMKDVQLVGDPKMPVKRVSVLVGGGSLGLGQENLPMKHMYQENIDVAICGDITEWTLSAYVRDASQLGMNKGMLVLGHERSEEWGMKHLPAWLKSITGDLPVTFVDAKEPFTYVIEK